MKTIEEIWSIVNGLKELYPDGVCSLAVSYTHLDVYKRQQWDRPETWRAFLRRIHTVIEYLPDGSTVIHKKGGIPCDPK